MGECCTNASNGPNGSKRNNKGILQPPKKEQSFKVVLLGETFVGKSSIVRRYNEDQFNQGHDVTIGGAYQ